MREPIGRTKASAPTQRKPREERWTELVQTATQVFYEKGYDAASLQDIADRLGILKGSLYYYIQSKEDLLFSVISSVHAEGLAKITAAAATEGDALTRLSRVIEAHVVHTCKNLVKVSVFLHELESLPKERRLEITGGDHSYQQVFRDLVNKAISEGQVRDGVDPTVATLSILGSINWVYRWFQVGGRVSVQRVSKQMTQLNIASIAKPEYLPD